MTQNKDVLERKTLVIKKVFLDTGKTKVGKSYKRTRILGDDKCYYTSFKDEIYDMPLKEGMSVNMSFFPGKIDKNFDIILLSIVDAPSDSLPTLSGGDSESSRATKKEGTVENQDVPSFDIDANAERAKVFVKRHFPDLDYSLYSPVLAEVMHEYFTLYENERIETNDLRKLKAYGKE